MSRVATVATLPTSGSHPETRAVSKPTPHSYDPSSLQECQGVLPDVSDLTSPTIPLATLLQASFHDPLNSQARGRFKASTRPFLPP